MLERGIGMRVFCELKNSLAMSNTVFVVCGDIEYSGTMAKILEEINPIDL